jgi:hypothetical protein
MFVHEPEAATEGDMIEYRAIIDRCPLVDLRDVRPSVPESLEEKRAKWNLKMAFARAFIAFANRHPILRMPSLANDLNDFRLEIGFNLLEKYGWSADEASADSIEPLEQWEASDREALKDLYRRAQKAPTRRSL